VNRETVIGFIHLADRMATDPIGGDGSLAQTLSRLSGSAAFSTDGLQCGDRMKVANRRRVIVSAVPAESVRSRIRLQSVTTSHLTADVVRLEADLCAEADSLSVRLASV